MRWLRVVAVSVALLLSGCLTENVEVKSLGTESQGFSRGGVLEHPPRSAAVILRETGGKLDAEVRWVGMCSRTERGLSRRVRIEKKELSATAYVVVGIFAAGTLAFLMWPDLDTDTSLEGGGIMAAVASVAYLIPRVQEKETKEELPPREVERPASPAPCFISRAGREPIVVKGRDATLEGRTNASGHIQFDATVATPVEVIVRGRPAGKVEWQK